jgi:hypothetical protein
VSFYRRARRRRRRRRRRSEGSIRLRGISVKSQLVAVCDVSLSNEFRPIRHPKIERKILYNQKKERKKEREKKERRVVV